MKKIVQNYFQKNDEIDLSKEFLSQKDKITVTEFKNPLKATKNGRAPGPKGLLTQHFKNGTHLLLDRLTGLQLLFKM